MFIVSAGRAATGSTEYFLPLGGGNISTGLSYLSEVVMPQACEVGRIAFRVVQAPGTTTIKVYKNGVEEDSLTPATVNAGTAYNFDFTASFAVGDRLAFSVNCANNNIDVQVNIQLILL